MTVAPRKVTPRRRRAGVQEITPEQFDLVAKLLRSREPVTSAVRAILIDGLTGPEALQKVNVEGSKRLSAQSVSNTLNRFSKTHEKILLTYGGRK